MEKHEAEAAIVATIKKIDAIRMSGLPKAEREAQVAVLSAEVKELKKITGPRSHVGNGGVTAKRG